jgi:hypothetical protein
MIEPRREDEGTPKVLISPGDYLGTFSDLPGNPRLLPAIVAVPKKEHATASPKWRRILLQLKINRGFLPHHPKQKTRIWPPLPNS